MADLDERRNDVEEHHRRDVSELHVHSDEQRDVSGGVHEFLRHSDDESGDGDDELTRGHDPVAAAIRADISGRGSSFAVARPRSENGVWDLHRK